MASTRIAVASLQRTTTPSRTSSRLISNAARTTSWCGVSRWQDDQYYSPTPTTTTRAPFLTYQSKEHTVFNVNTTMSINEQIKPPRPGSIAFGECEIAALSDLFLQFAKTKEEEHRTLLWNVYDYSLNPLVNVPTNPPFKTLSMMLT